MSYCNGLYPCDNKQDWCTSIVQNLTQSLFCSRVRVKRFYFVNGDLYVRASGEVLAAVVSKAEAKEELQRIHELSCGDMA